MSDDRHALEDAEVLVARIRDGRLELDVEVDQQALWRYVQAEALRIGADPEHWPWRADTADGIVKRREFEHSTAQYGRAWARAEIAEHAARWTGKKARPAQRGPEPMVSQADVERARRELVAGGERASERAIGRKLNVSRGAVRYALGRDRRG